MAQEDTQAESELDSHRTEEIANGLETDLAHDPSAPSSKQGEPAGEDDRSSETEIALNSHSPETPGANPDASPPQQSTLGAGEDLSYGESPGSEALASESDSAPPGHSPLRSDELHSTDEPLVLALQDPPEGERELPQTGVGAPDLPGEPRKREDLPPPALADHGPGELGRELPDVATERARESSPLAAAAAPVFLQGPQMLVPEPSTALLVGAGLVGFALRRRAGRSRAR